MSDPGRKPLTDQVSQKITPDSQKSPLDKASDTVTGTADSIAGSVQPGDSKSTSQKLSDETRSGGNTAGEKLSAVGENIQGTAAHYADKAQEQTSGDKTGAAKGYVEQASDAAASVATNVQETAAHYANQAQNQSGTAGGSAQGKTIVEQVQDIASNALNTASKAASDLANSISQEKK